MTLIMLDSIQIEVSACKPSMQAVAGDNKWSVTDTC